MVYWTTRSRSRTLAIAVAWLGASACRPARPVGVTSAGAGGATAPAASATTAESVASVPTPDPKAATQASTDVALPRSESPLRFSRVLDVPVVSVAFGERSRAAVLADAPYLFDGSTWTRRELPAALQAGDGATHRTEIFFGRDNQPRLMGERIEASGRRTPVYLRYVAAGWRREPSELGPLARSQNALYGILGFADPEVVCAVGELCLIKRVTGWARVSADESPRRMFLTDVGVFKQADGALQRLAGSSWTPELPLDFEPTGLCHRKQPGTVGLWVVGGSPPALWRRREATEPLVAVSPLLAPRDVHCAPSGEVWVGGDDGVAWYDGTSWVQVAGDFGRVSRVVGRLPGEVWLAGERGLFTGTRR